MEPPEIAKAMLALADAAAKAADEKAAEAKAKREHANKLRAEAEKSTGAKLTDKGYVETEKKAAQAHLHNRHRNPQRH